MDEEKRKNILIEDETRPMQNIIPQNTVNKAFPRLRELDPQQERGSRNSGKTFLQGYVLCKNIFALAMR